MVPDFVKGILQAIYFCDQFRKCTRFSALESFWTCCLSRHKSRCLRWNLEQAKCWRTHSCSLSWNVNVVKYHTLKTISPGLIDVPFPWHFLTPRAWLPIQSYTLPISQSFNPTLFQSYTLPISHSSNPTPFHYPISTLGNNLYEPVCQLHSC